MLEGARIPIAFIGSCGRILNGQRQIGAHPLQRKGAGVISCAAASPRQRRRPMADETVLVVDDSPTILKLVQLVLTKGGYRVATASSGEEGLVSAHDDPPALILLDYLMPDMNGD